MHVEVADFSSDDAPNTATQEVQKTQRADMDHQARAPWTCGRQVLCEWQNFDAKRTKRARSGLRIRIKQQRLKSPPPSPLFSILYDNTPLTAAKAASQHKELTSLSLLDTCG